jgi:PKD repeat protein
MFRQELITSVLIICFILASVPVASCISSPPIIYVSGNGADDFNCNGTNDQIQINQALQLVADNPEYTTVHLNGSFTYVINDTIMIGNNTILEGDPTAVIKLADHAGWPTMKPLIQQMSNLGNDNITVRGFEVDGNYAGNSEITLGRGFYNVMYFVNSSNLTVCNMYMHDGTGDGMRINRGKNIKYYNNTIYKLGHDGLYAIRSENVEAWNNRITCRTNSALRVWNTNYVKFHDNVIDSFFHWSAGGPGIQIEKSDWVMDNIEVYNNIIHDTYGPGIWIVTHDTNSSYQDQGKNIHIHNNIFYNTSTNPSITWVGGIVASGFKDTLVENNVFDGCYGAAIAHIFSAAYTPKGGFTTIVRNNIIVNTHQRTKDPNETGCGIANYLPDTHFFVIDNDCLYNNSGGDYKNCASTTDLYVDPLVVDLINHDYHLQSIFGRWDGRKWVKDDVSSLCIDAGYRFSDYFNEPDSNGYRINIGPDGNTRYASKSVFKPPWTRPTANFSSNVTNGTVPLTVKFTDLSNNATAWKWDFGDGSNSMLQNPIHTYSAAGINEIKLSVINANGMDSKTGKISAVKDESISNPLPMYNNRLREASPENIYPNSSFIDIGGMNSGSRYRDVIWLDLSGYTDATQTNNTILSLIWYYPNSPRLNDTVIEIYRPASTWNSSYVSWNKRDSNISWSNPGGDWYDKNGILQGSVPYATLTLKASSLPSNNYCDFDVTDLVREYTSGKYSNTGFLLKARNEGDNYIAFYRADCKLYSSTSILPTANFSSNVTTGNVPLAVQFTDLSENAAGWNWDFGDGADSNQQNPDHIYSTAGNYTVSLTANNGNGTNSKLAVIAVKKSIPEIIWSKPADIVYGTALGSTQLNASASVPGTFAYTPATGTVLSAGTQTLHVDFTPADAANCTIASKNVTINVSEKPVLPSANFSTNVTNGTAPLTVKFTDLSKNATFRTWNFGDSTNSTQQSPMHTYSAAGNYKVTLTVGNSNGTDSMTRNISVVKKEIISNLSGIYNNRLREASPENIYSDSSFIDVGGMSGVGRYRDVIWFDLGAYTSDKQISSATLSLFWYYPNSSRLKDTVVEIYKPASAWNSSYVSWNKKNKGIAWNKSGGDWYDSNGVLQGSTPYATLTLGASVLPSNSYCELNVTNIVREYVSGKYSNTGFLIKARNESDNYVAFYSTQCGNASEVPKLKLVYS